MNTRSQGVTNTMASNSGDEDLTTDNSLTARRRRRRERAQTAYIMNSAQSVDGIGTGPQPDNVPTQRPITEIEGHQMTLAERRLLRTAFSLNSMDREEVFYDAVPMSNNSAAVQKQL